jgi:hypothetical protein
MMKAILWGMSAGLFVLGSALPEKQLMLSAASMVASGLCLVAMSIYAVAEAIEGRWR